MPVQLRPPHPAAQGGDIMMRFVSRSTLFFLILIALAAPALGLALSGNLSDPSLCGLVYEIVPDVMPLIIDTQGSNWLYSGDNLALLYKDGEYSLLGGHLLSDGKTFSIEKTVPLASGGSSAWTTTDVSTALGSMSTIGSYLMGTGSTTYTYYRPGMSEGTSRTDTNLARMLGVLITNVTANQSTIANRLLNGSLSMLLYEAGGTTSASTPTSLGAAFQAFANYSTLNQSHLFDALIGSSGSTSYTYYRPGTEGTSRTDTNLARMLGVLITNVTANQTSIYSKFMGSSGSISASSYFHGQSSVDTRNFSSLGQLLGWFMTTSTLNSVLPSGTSFLGNNGLSSTSTTYLSGPSVSAAGFNGLAAILRGTSGSVISAKSWSFDSDLIKSVATVQYSNVLQALADISTKLQNPLSQLQAVLANDDDLALRQVTQPQVDEFTSGFTGSGAGAPSLSDIADMASFSGQIGSLFDSGSSVGDFFSAATSADAYQFFSQAVADDLDSSSAVMTLSLDDTDPLEGFVLGEDGFYTLADTSFFDLSFFRGGE